MKVIDQLKTLSAAEDFFRILDVPYDAAVLNVARLHILKRMGEYLRKSTMIEVEEDATRALFRNHLERAYRDFLESSPLEQRVFKVLKEAVSAPVPPLVQITAITSDQRS